MKIAAASEFNLL